MIIQLLGGEADIETCVCLYPKRMVFQCIPSREVVVKEDIAGVTSTVS